MNILRWRKEDSTCNIIKKRRRERGISHILPLFMFIEKLKILKK